MDKIIRVTATPLYVPARFEMSRGPRDTALSVCYVEVETDQGIIGHGISSITEEEVIASIVNEVAGPAILGLDPLGNEAIWDRLYWLLAPRGQTGYAMHSIAAIDIALWDIKGKTLGLPIYKLLGGARSRIPLYTTFGFGFMDRDELAEVAQQAYQKGFRDLKMVVGHSALQRRDEPRPLTGVIREDARRVETVRAAIGTEASLYIDANCSLDLFHAEKLANAVSQCDIAFFEEPITQNDARQLAELRQRTGVAVAAGQNEGLAFRFRDLLMAQSVDVLQPNVVIGGGFTQCAKIAGLASAFNVPIANGGAYPLHNMHLHAGLANGGKAEWHLIAVAMMKAMYLEVPEPEDGWLTLPDEPGLGFEPNRDAIRELARMPTSHGHGK